MRFLWKKGEFIPNPAFYKANYVYIDKLFRINGYLIILASIGKKVKTSIVIWISLKFKLFYSIKFNIKIY